MAKLTDKDLLSNPAAGDFIHVVDVSDTTEDVTGTSKRSTIQSIVDLVSVEAGGETYTTAEKSKLAAIEALAKDDQTGSEIEALLDAELGSTDWKTGGGGGTVDIVSNVAQNRILGRTASGPGDSEELTAAQVRTFLNVEDGAAADQDLSSYAETADVLEKTNTTAFTPTADYHPATKKYVDDEITGAGGYNDEAAQDAVAGILTDSSEIDFTYSDGTPSITAAIVAGSLDETKLDTSVNASLDLADSAQQPPSEGAFVDGDKTKLDGIEAGADVTDTANVDAAITKTGSDSAVVSGTAGTDGNLVAWNADGDAVDAGFGVTTGTPGKGSFLVGDGTSEYDEVTAGTNDQIVVYDSGEANGVKKVDLDSSIQFVIDGGGSAITTGIKGDIEVPFDCTIEQVTMAADQSGSVVVDVWSDTYANFPATDADSITASAVPTISSATKSQDSTLTGWTTSLTQGDILRFNVDSAATCERVTISLRVRRTF